MAQPITIELAGSSNQGRFGLESTARLVNCYKETLGPEAKNQFALYAVNGLNLFASLSGASGGVRAMMALDSELLVVAGRQFYSVDISGVATIKGGIATDSLVTMARNRQAPNPQAVIVSDGQWLIYQNGELELGSDVDLEAPIYVTEKDGYFVFLSESGRFTISGIDSTTIDGLDFATAASDADGGVALATRGSDLIIFGTRSTEFWTNTGNADFPFERQTYRGYGCYSAGSVSEITALIDGQMIDSVVWAATDETGAFTGLFLLSGYGAVKISTYEIDRKIKADTMPGNIRSFAWSENGHVFYTIRGTGYAHTYDTVEKAWHERKSQHYDYWRATAHETFGGLAIFGDSVGGELWSSSIDVYNEDGAPIQMSIELPVVHAFPYELALTRVILDAQTGVGLNSTDEDYSDPEVAFDMSWDGGYNFDEISVRPVGKQGQTLQKIDWWGLGMIPRQGAVLRFRMSPNVRRAVLGVAIAVDQLSA